jgi:hypothetical protein
MTSFTQTFVEETKRIRIKRIPTNHTLMENNIRIYTGYGPFGSRDIANTIRDKLNVKPNASLWVSYRNDPFNVSNSDIYERYGFVDFTGIDNLEDVGLMERRALLQGESVTIEISPSESWLLSIQDASVNLLRNSECSETCFIFPTNHRLNRIISENNNEENLDEETEETIDNPFCAGEISQGLGYRDAYECWIFE